MFAVTLYHSLPFVLIRWSHFSSAPIALRPYCSLIMVKDGSGQGVLRTHTRDHKCHRPIFLPMYTVGPYELLLNPKSTNVCFGGFWDFCPPVFCPPVFCPPVICPPVFCPPTFCPPGLLPPVFCPLGLLPPRLFPPMHLKIYVLNHCMLYS